ncbi:MAG: hypothetical protein U0Y68_04080 [Blastocatellia bacterium]
MPYIRVFVADDQFEQLLQLGKVYQMSVASLLRPYVSGTVIQLWSAYSDANNRPLHQRIVKIAMGHQNTTIEELVEWTGLDRCIVKTTLSELVELDEVREHAGRGKVVNYFLKDNPNAKSKKS